MHIDIPPEIRRYLIEVLNQTLSCSVDLRSQVKQACWNVKGRDFASLHTFFATLATELEAYTDLLAERIALLGGVALGTARTAARHSTLPEYLGATVEGNAHLVALAERFAHYAIAVRGGITLAADVEEVGSAALYTEISRWVDKQLWVLDAHLHR
jgi:starvation-inducible DNA-binding protein